MTMPKLPSPNAIINGEPWFDEQQMLDLARAVAEACASICDMYATTPAAIAADRIREAAKGIGK